jgi:hypothetical protein
MTPGSGMGKKSRSRSEMNIPDHISDFRELRNNSFFWVRILKLVFDADPDPGSEIFLTLIRDPG